jgi:SAM-dependent methyltransferase
MEKYLAMNRDMWDKLVGVNVGSKFYDVEGFKQGECSLMEIERQEMGEVLGKRLLHLQCHFGMDTLSWARLGAQVTGVDFSEQAIETARLLAAEVGIAAEFVCCEISKLPDNLSEQFDIVFTSGGVLHWLPDLTKWAEVIAHFLKPGGFFYIREYHPFACVFDDEKEATVPKLRYPYFPAREPIRCEGVGTYADPTADIHVVTYEWTHSMGEIINVLISAGLRIEYLHEFDYCEYKSHPFLKQDNDGKWRALDIPGGLPLMFSLKAVKESHTTGMKK